MSVSIAVSGNTYQRKSGLDSSLRSSVARVDVGKPGLIMPGTSGFPLHPRDSISITLQDLLTPGCCITAHVERHVRKLPAEPPDLLLTLLTICRALSLSLGQAQGRLVGACASPALPVNGLSRYPLPSRPRIPKCMPLSKTGSRCSYLVGTQRGVQPRPWRRTRVTASRRRFF